MKKQLNYISAMSLRELMQTVNNYNASASSPILREDVVQIMKEGDGYVLLYYK